MVPSPEPADEDEIDPAIAFLAGDPDSFDEFDEDDSPDERIEDADLSGDLLAFHSDSVEDDESLETRHRTDEPEEENGDERSGIPVGDEDGTSRLSDLIVEIPEEDRDFSDIAGKLDPPGLPHRSGFWLKPERKPGRKTRSPKKEESMRFRWRDCSPTIRMMTFSSIDDSTRKAAEVLEQTLKEFKIEARVNRYQKGDLSSRCSNSCRLPG